MGHKEKPLRTGLLKDSSYTFLAIITTFLITFKFSTFYLYSIQIQGKQLVNIIIIIVDLDGLLLLAFLGVFILFISKEVLSVVDSIKLHCREDTGGIGYG